ncbi:hypothetical protein K431DRAFT_333967 [Polychaeton citri CBS 116435]|uniref:DUF1996 domain-containing protein n=1 Tax=Polychaeton citri CBS 116435 TaxID=1314669 RepID=A0A9P4UM06_9PEZI|nr:hypothetical protein K431DRAFT_333967 [Polychaeton citri CBS 116435]
MKTTHAVSALALVGNAAAFWRMPCRSRTGLGRIDPIVDPGTISSHVHAIHGGKNFGFNTTSDDLVDSSCTSCAVTQDRSAYWTPALYFQYHNGTTVLVEQVGGMLAYYLYYLEKVKAFPHGFQMVAGKNNLRHFDGPIPDVELSLWPTDASNQTWLGQRALGFNCLNYGRAPEASLYRHSFPKKDYMDANCVDGMRLELAFPSCWNGELSSEDHSSHVAYPSLVKEGNCPDTHPEHLPFLFYETIWDTYAFAGEDGIFVLSPGDPDGAGYHGDFMMGWESEKFLQDALDNCTSPSGEISDCPMFDIQHDDLAAQCTFDVPEELSNDNCHGPRQGLPVNVPIQFGPNPATKFTVAGQDGAATQGPPSYSGPPSTWATEPESQTYSAADPHSTSTALGGIVVAMKSSDSDDEASITAAPSITSSSSGAVATSYITQGDEVVELVIEEVDVTVTATATAVPDSGMKHKRHLEHHLRHNHVRH